MGKLFKALITSAINMEHSHTHSDQSTCCKTSNNVGVRQTFTEMDFERGIWYAAQHNDVDRVKMLLKKGVSPNAEDLAGYTALHYAARNGHYETCVELLDNGAIPNAQTRCGHATALHRASLQNHLHVVTLLLKFGANPNLKDADGYTPLHKAIMARSMSICKLLIPHTNLSLLNDGPRCIEHFAKEKFPDILPLLLTRI